MMLENKARLKAIATMEASWDGEGARVVPQPTIASFEKVLGGLIQQTWVLPLVTGGIGMTFRKPDDSYMNFRMFSDKVEMLYIPQMDYRKAHEEVETDQDLFVSFMNKWIGKFHDK